MSKPVKAAAACRSAFVLLMIWISLSASLSAADNISTESKELRDLKINTYLLPPWVVEDEGDLYGLAIDHLEQVEDNLTFQLDVHVYPWIRAEKTSRANTPSPVALFPCNPTEERSVHFLFTKQFKGSASVLMGLDGGPVQAPMSLDQLAERQRQLVIGVRKGHILERDLKLNGIRYESVSTLEQLITLLLLNRLDVIYDYQVSLQDYFNEHPTLEGDKTFKQYPVRDVNYGFCINKHSDNAQRYRDQLNQAIDQI